MLTTNQKITVGFTLMIGIIATLAFVGYKGLDNTSQGFNTYTGLSNMNVTTNEAVAAVGDAAYYAALFARNAEPGNMKQAQQSLAKAEGLFKNLLKDTRLPAIIENINIILNDINQYEENLLRLEKQRSLSIKYFEETIIPALKAVEDLLQALGEQTYEASNSASLHSVEMAWPFLATLRASLIQLVEREYELDAEAADTALRQIGNAFLDLNTLLMTKEGRALSADLGKAQNAFITTFETMKTNVAASRIATMNASNTIATIKQHVATLATVLYNLRTANGKDMLQFTDSTLRQMLLVAIIGLMLGLVLAILIGISITRTLQKLSEYFVRIEAGDFQAESGVTEKGAIGNMVTIMQGIPALLNQITQEINELAEKITIGSLRDRFDTTHYTGGFAVLGKSVNTLAGAYTTVIDSLPNPIIACTAECSIVFLNHSAQELLGGDQVNTRCYQHFGVKECQTADCFGAVACQQNSMHAGETSAVLKGKAMDIAVIAIPLWNTKGAQVGFLKLVTDLTELKSQQRLILKTAADASEIADRVAAASEELSAQVEQITRGTDHQKIQVESTSSAMSEMNKTVLEVARNASQASSQTDDTRQKADSGAMLVNDVVRSINQVNTVANALQDNMQELGTQAENIGSVMNVISDIADQTNLLALNAAIEAARAGDAGRGFAVVADEVRKLAEKTMEATHEVGQNINAIQNSARVNIAEVAKAVISVTEATNLANSSGQALSEIVDLATSSSTIVASIATAADGQSSTSEEINHSLTEISQIVTEITTNMEQSAAALHELSNMSQALRSLMEKLH